MSSILNKKRLLRGRTVGFTLIGIMAFLVFGFVFIADEPLTVQITDEIDIQICPPYCDEAFFELPVPEFEVRTMEATPIITTTDDLGNSVTTRGETTFLQQITGFSITMTGDPNNTFDDGRLKIELELVTDLQTDERITVIGSLESIESSITGGNTATVGFADSGLTEQGVFVAELLNIRIDDLVPDVEAVFHYDFVVGDITVDFDQIKFSNEAPFTIYSVDYASGGDLSVGIDDPPLPFPLPEICDPEILNSTGICAPLCTNENPCEGGGLPIGEPCTDCEIIIIVEEIPPIPEEVIVEEVVEDVPNITCPSVEFDSISFLFPTNEISGTTTLWDKTADGSDKINADLRNNRNCDLEVAIDSQWRAVTGEVFVTQISGITILTNQTVALVSQPFDGRADCNGSCAGQEVQFCFFGQVSELDDTEIVDEFCGKKFFR